jgi:hypothetical protein
VKSKVETQDNIGKIISIDIDTGDYEIGDDILVTANRLLNKHKEAAIWSERIGLCSLRIWWFAASGSIMNLRNRCRITKGMKDRF